MFCGVDKLAEKFFPLWIDLLILMEYSKTRYAGPIMKRLVPFRAAMAWTTNSPVVPTQFGMKDFLFHSLLSLPEIDFFCLWVEPALEVASRDISGIIIGLRPTPYADIVILTLSTVSLPIKKKMLDILTYR